MKPVVVFFLSCFLPVLGLADVVINGDVWFGDKYVDSDVFIDTGVTYAPNMMTVMETINLENNGELKTDVYLCDRCDLFVRNRGVINSNFYLGDSARLIQVVSDERDVDDTDFGVSYSVLVDGANNLSLEHVIDVFDGADRVILQNSVLDVNRLTPGIDTELVINGEVGFVIDDLNGLYDVVFLENVSGNGLVRVITDNSDVMFSDVAYIRDGNLFFTRVRETDYSKIFKDDLGVFLDFLRIRDVNDDLILALDGANDMKGLYDVMGKSVRLNPNALLNLMRAVGRVVAHDFNYSDGVVLSPIFGWGDDFHVWGLNIGYFDGFAENGRWGMVLHAGNIDYESDVDVFSGIFYGAGLVAKYDFENNLFLRGTADFLRYSMDIDYAFYDNNVVESPSGDGIRMRADMGYKLDFADSFLLTPFIGVDVGRNDIAFYDKKWFDAHVGLDVGYDYDMLGIKYNYNFGINANINSEFEVLGRIGFWADADMLGGGIAAGVISVSDIIAYKLLIDACVKF